MNPKDDTQPGDYAGDENWRLEMTLLLGPEHVADLTRDEMCRMFIDALDSGAQGVEK